MILKKKSVVIWTLRSTLSAFLKDAVRKKLQKKKKNSTKKKMITLASYEENNRISSITKKNHHWRFLWRIHKHIALRNDQEGYLNWTLQAISTFSKKHQKRNYAPGIYKNKLDLDIHPRRRVGQVLSAQFSLTFLSRKEVHGLTGAHISPSE